MCVVKLTEFERFFIKVQPTEMKYFNEKLSNQWIYLTEFFGYFVISLGRNTEINIVRIL